MHSIPRAPTASDPGSAKSERLTSDLVYQGMTIAAILWLLASLWAF